MIIIMLLLLFAYEMHIWTKLGTSTYVQVAFNQLFLYN